MKKVTKAVFPVAGLGSRFLPATKASPKEMLPIVDKPLIQYAVEEAIAAGLTDLVFITGRNKRAIEDHFDKAYELEAALEMRGKSQVLELIQSIIPKHVNCIFIRQVETLGLGHAVLCARPVVGNEPFAVILADDLIDANPSALGQMIEKYNYYNCSVLAVENIPQEQTGQYGIVKCGPTFDAVHQITGIVEKPRPSEAPSTLGVIGRYILMPGIFQHLQKIQPGAGGEIQLTDGIASLLREEQVLAYEFNGTRYDCGSKLGYLKATLTFGLMHPEVGQDFGKHLLDFADRKRSAARPVALVG